MNNPILTIGIPTYNRPKNIQETVRLLLPQLNDRVKLVVHDNCSDIPVSELFTDEEKTKFSIIRNRVNIGGDANIAGVIYHADTKWVWDLGDDDFPTPSAVSIIMDKIEKYPDALMLNFNTYKKSHTKNFDELAKLCSFRYMFSNLLFISSGVYNRDKLKADLFQYYKNLSSMVGQAILILKHLERQPDELYFFPEKIVHHSVDGIELELDAKVKPRIHERPNWSRVTFVKRSSVIFEEFESKRKFLNGNLFKGIALEYLRIVFDTSMSNANFFQRISLFCYVARTVGLFNIFRYNSHVLAQFFVKFILPSSLYRKIKRKAKLKYVEMSK